MKYGELNFGQVEAIVNKLGGMDGVKRFLSGELMVVEKTNVRFKVFKTIKLGTIKLGITNVEYPGLDLSRILQKNKDVFNDELSAILNAPVFVNSVATKETEVILAVASARELGLNDRSTRNEIYKRAQEFGLRLCPAEVGPQLRLQYKNQPKGENLIIGMEPINHRALCPAADGRGKIFCVGHRYGERALTLLSSGSDTSYPQEDRWVFLLS